MARASDSILHHGLRESSGVMHNSPHRDKVLPCLPPGKASSSSSSLSSLNPSSKSRESRLPSSFRPLRASSDSASLLFSSTSYSSSPSSSSKSLPSCPFSAKPPRPKSVLHVEGSKRLTRAVLNLCLQVVVCVVIVSNGRYVLYRPRYRFHIGTKA